LPLGKGLQLPKQGFAHAFDLHAIIHTFEWTGCDEVSRQRAGDARDLRQGIEIGGVEKFEEVAHGVSYEVIVQQKAWDENPA
jgi:hypothetical protein